MDKISIIVPAYNEEARIYKCIKSILDQTYQMIELIVVDDGSTDNTFEVINNFHDSRIHVSSIKNSGQGHARNVGIDLSSGKYIMFVDSDDYVDPNIVEVLYQKIKDEDSDISICNIIKEYSNKSENFVNYNNCTNDKIANFMISHPGPVARLYKRDLFIKNNIYFKENCIYEDLATIPKLGLYAKRISYIDEYLYHYVIRENSSMNQSKYNEKLDDIFKVMDDLTNNFDINNEYYYHILEYLYIEHLLYSANMRFLNYKEGITKVKKISNIIKEKFPNWKDNKYYKLKSIKFKVFCMLAFKKRILLCKVLKKLGGK